mmetsp:Transcript_7888/g.11712  ORF Transcript_7888/g.11712 Transcript_7888/m.11712 type:complete len:197 (-) Transcript_7888:189-779(-)
MSATTFEATKTPAACHPLPHDDTSAREDEVPPTPQPRRFLCECDTAVNEIETFELSFPMLVDANAELQEEEPNDDCNDDEPRSPIPRISSDDRAPRFLSARSSTAYSIDLQDILSTPMEDDLALHDEGDDLMIYMTIHPSLLGAAAVVPSKKQSLSKFFEGEKQNSGGASLLMPKMSVTTTSLPSLDHHALVHIHC